MVIFLPYYATILYVRDSLIHIDVDKNNKGYVLDDHGHLTHTLAYVKVNQASCVKREESRGSHV